MIPPIPVSAGTYRYTLDALVLRSTELGRIAAQVAHAATTVATPGHILWDTVRGALCYELERVSADIARVRDDIDGVIATIDPSESHRATLMSGAPWATLRPFTQSVIDHTPWATTATDFIPMAVTERAADVSPPRNLAERWARIPHDGGDVRIDRFNSPSGLRFEVYVSGTDFRDGPDNPWWVGSNAEFVASGQSRSLSATESALAQAGVTSRTPLVITGHSQGGIIALALAASARYTVDAVFTVGTPTGFIAEVADVPIVHVAHPEDPVPALGGDVRLSPGTTWIAHTEPRTLGANAHRAESYGSTIDQIVDAEDADLVTLERSVFASVTGSATWFRATTTE